MRLDELIEALAHAERMDAPMEYAVSVMLDGNSFPIDHVEVDTDGTFRIYLEV
jgi:hypothetical protein